MTRRVKCPLCNRLVLMSTMIKNTKGEPIMEWHFSHETWLTGGLAACAVECKGSHTSLTDATDLYIKSLNDVEDRPATEREIEAFDKPLSDEAKEQMS